LVEGQLRLFVSVCRADYQADTAPIVVRGQVQEPDEAALEMLRQFLVRRVLAQLDGLESVRPTRSAAEDYIQKGFVTAETELYSKYEGARFTDLFKRQRELPLGAKLQNHALNSRLNDEFKKYYPTVEKQPVVRETGSALG
jgi:hypothetical protein